MIVFLLVLSLFLNMMALFAVIVLFSRQNRLMAAEKKQEKMLNEMEEVISAYLVQMKEDNEAFINRIRNIEIKRNSINEVDIQPRQTDPIPEGDMQEKLLQNRIGKAPAYHAVQAYRKNVQKPGDGVKAAMEEPENDNILGEIPPLGETVNINSKDAKKSHKINAEEIPEQEMPLIDQVMLLRDQGYSEEEIAKKLNKGKTEIALLLKFRHNQQ